MTDAVPQLLAQLGGVQPRRFVVTHESLHLVLAEDGGDAPYQLLDSAGRCDIARLRLGSGVYRAVEYEDVTLFADVG